MEEILEITPKSIQFSISQKQQSIQLQNLTLHFFNVKLISPNPTLYTIIPNSFKIEPYTPIEVNIIINFDQRLNQYAILQNKKIIVYYYDMDVVEESIDNFKEWNQLSLEYLGRQTIDIIYETNYSNYHIQQIEKYKKFIDNVQIFQVLNLNNNTITLNDEHKKALMNKFLELFSKYSTYKVMEDKILFIGNYFDYENEIYCVTNQQSLIFIGSYKPSFYLYSYPQIPLEIVSPQQEKKNKKLFQINKQTIDNNIPQIEKQVQQVIEEVSPVKQLFNFNLFNSKSQEKEQSNKKSDQNEQEQDNKEEIQIQIQTQNQIIQQTNDQQINSQQQIQKELPNIQKSSNYENDQIQQSLPESRINRNLDISQITGQQRNNSKKKNPRSQSINERRDQKIQKQEKELEWDKKAKVEQQQKIAPPVIFTGKEQNINQQATYKVNELATLKTYQQIVEVLIFKDGKYLLTIGEKQEIKVWQLSIKGLIGTIKELENKKDKKILIIQEWKYMDPAADENYEFELKDPTHNQCKELYTAYETAYRFITGSEDQIFRIFNLTTMSLEQQFSCRLQIPTSLAFMPDRGLFCIGGQPYKTIFGQTRKYRSIRFFRMNNLQEKPKYKIFCKSDDEYLNKIIYSENPPDSTQQHQHVRLNNILAIQIFRKNSQGKQIIASDRLLFVFMDRMNQCTVLMTLECEMLNIRGVYNLKYLYKEGVFAIIESNDVAPIKNQKLEQNTQKVVLINLKQLGSQSGIECNLIQEQRSRTSLQILTNPSLLVIPKLKQIVIQNLQGEDQIVHDLESGISKINGLFFLSTLNNYIVIVINDVVSVISVV